MRSRRGWHTFDVCSNIFKAFFPPLVIVWSGLPSVFLSVLLHLCVNLKKGAKLGFRVSYIYIFIPWTLTPIDYSIIFIIKKYYRAVNSDWLTMINVNCIEIRNTKCTLEKLCIYLFVCVTLKPFFHVYVRPSWRVLCGWRDVGIELLTSHIAYAVPCLLLFEVLPLSLLKLSMQYWSDGRQPFLILSR